MIALLGVDQVDVWQDVVLAAKVEHLLRLLDASNEGACNLLATPDDAESMHRKVVGGNTKHDEAGAGASLEGAEERGHVVVGRDSVEKQVNGPCRSSHLSGIRSEYKLGTQLVDSLLLVGRVAEDGDGASGGKGDLYGHVTEAAETGDTNGAVLALLEGAPEGERRVGCDARAEEGCSLGHVHAVGDAKNVVLINSHLACVLGLGLKGCEERSFHQQSPDMHQKHEVWGSSLGNQISGFGV